VAKHVSAQQQEELDSQAEQQRAPRTQSKRRPTAESCRPKRRRANKVDTQEFDRNHDGSAIAATWDLHSTSLCHPGIDLSEKQLMLHGEPRLSKSSPNTIQGGDNSLVTFDVSDSAPGAVISCREADELVPTRSKDAPPQSTTQVPHGAPWFDTGSIHEKERSSLPDFFSGKFPSKNSHTYRQYRSFIINTYKQHTGTCLLRSSCRQSLAGDIGAIAEVHNNLDLWGVINVPAMLDVEELRLACSIRNSIGHSKMQKLHHFEKPSTNSSAHVRQQWGSSRAPSLGGCHEEMNSASTWRDVETLMLLQALQVHQDNWDSVAAEVPNKTKEQCVTHFVRMAIIDPFVENTLDRQLQTAAEDQIPFVDSGNALLGQMQFLCNTVHPGVAGAAASAGLQRLQQLHRGNDAHIGATTNLRGGNALHEMNDSTEPMSYAFSAAVMRAKKMADTEERRIQLLVLEAIKLQAQKMELKARHFKDLEDMMQLERQKVAKACSDQERDHLAQSNQLSRLNRSGKPEIQLVAVTPVPTQEPLPWEQPQQDSNVENAGAEGKAGVSQEGGGIDLERGRFKASTRVAGDTVEASAPSAIGTGRRYKGDQAEQQQHIRSTEEGKAQKQASEEGALVHTSQEARPRMGNTEQASNRVRVESQIQRWRRQPEQHQILVYEQTQVPATNEVHAVMGGQRNLLQAKSAQSTAHGVPQPKDVGHWKAAWSETYVRWYWCVLQYCCGY
jgi:hypothetical protein